MTDWAAISALATAGETLVLPIATFASVHSANRSAHTAELALQEQHRPALVQQEQTPPRCSELTQRHLNNVTF